MTTAALSGIDTQITDFYQKGSPIGLETKDLVLASVQESDLPFFQSVHTDFDTMKLYADNEPRMLEIGLDAWKEEQMKYAATRVATSVKRWIVDKNPLSEFVIWKKEAEKKSPIGFIVATATDKPGKLETAFVIRKEAQGLGYGLQAIQALLQTYLPALIENHLKIFGRPLLIQELPVKEVFATARLDNPASIRTLEKAGMKKIGEDLNSPLGRPRGIYSLTYT